MKNTFRSTVLAALLFAALPAQAALQSYNFSGTLDSGVYSGQSFSGSFSFDDATLSNIGDEWLSVNSLNMSFLGSNYNLSNSTFGADVGYSSGTFLGLSYTVESSALQFSLVADTAPFLAYDTTAGLSGAGDIVYQPVPEPESYALLLAGLGLLGAVTRRWVKAV